MFLDYVVGFLTGLMYFVIIFIPAIVIHEFGHLIMARLCGVKIPEFGVGMPFTKPLAQTKKFGIVWSFYPILLGGFVRIFGDNDAVDTAYDLNKTNPQEAKEYYQDARLNEILGARETKYFLAKNGLEYNKTWTKFENSSFASGKVNPKEGLDIADFESKTKQLRTLIDWEFDAQINAKDTFYHKNWLQQTLIILGGVTFNFATAFVCFWLIFSFFFAANTPRVMDIESIAPFVSNSESVVRSDYVYPSIVEGGLAYNAGMRGGDKLFSFAGQPLGNLSSVKDFRDLVLSKKNQTIEFVYQSAETNEMATKQVLLEEKDGKVLFGVGSFFTDISFQKLNAAGISFNQIGKFVRLNFEGLSESIKALNPAQKDRSALDQIGGPILFSASVKKYVKVFDMMAYLNFLAAISIGLGVFNLLPIPALDGGRWVIITITKLLGRRNRKIEGIVIGITFILLMGLGLVIAGFDIFRIFRK